MAIKFSDSEREREEREEQEEVRVMPGVSRGDMF